MLIRNLLPTIALIFALFLSGFFAPVVASAGSVIAIRTVPDTPPPDTTATVLIESFTFDIKGAYIIWKINGEVVAEGVGETSYRFTTPASGKEVFIEAFVALPGGKEFKESLRFKPSTVDLLWQADTYVPPFYKGKALPTHRSRIRAVAIPAFAAGEDAKRQVYAWNINRSTRAGQGTGVSTTNVEATWDGSRISLSVDVQSQDKVARASRTVSIASVKPEIRFYEHSPLYGVRYDHALSERIRVSAPEYIVRAVPYFFSKPDRDYGYLVYRWNIDGRDIELPPGNQDDLTILGGESVSRNIFLKVYSEKRVTQVAANGVMIDFSNNEQR